MALFGIGKKNTKVQAAKTDKPGKAAVSVVSAVGMAGMKDVLMRPRVTEKAADLSSNNVYTFDVRPGATKKEILDAVKSLYKVTPQKINVVNTPAKRVTMRNRRGFGKTSASRKAYVFLKKGEQINIA
jgi:large subunit ribosomal protein L23